MKIFLVDIIGEHSGAFYYNRAFRETLASRFPDVEIISNYSEPDGNSRKLFVNYYKRNLFSKFISLFVSLFRLLFLVLGNRKECFIFMTYGNAYETLFLITLLPARKLIIDVHEVISLIDTNRTGHFFRESYARILYQRFADAVIIHSKRSSDFLDELGYKGVRLEVPHFSYKLNPLPEEIPVLPEVESLVSGSKINILFFGFMRLTKGSDVVAELISRAGGFDPGNRLNFIIAGNDTDNIWKQFQENHKDDSELPVRLLIRYITDPELRYLFKMCDYVFLPYRHISQSGVLEMAVYFRKPVITSGLPYFRETLGMFPSFGFAAEGTETDGYINTFRSIAAGESDTSGRFYNVQDMDHFIEYKNPQCFLNEMESIIESGK